MNTININRKKITSAEIEKFKNFQSIKENFSSAPKQSLVNKTWMNFSLSAAAIVVVSSLAWFFVVQKPSKLENNRRPQVKSYFINPPIPQYNIPFKKVVYYNTCDTTICFSPTSKIEIKRNSLIDSTGKIIVGPIEIRYREFMNPAEIFLSGIPMAYDSAGIKTNFESAGMIEIAAFNQNKPLFIVPEKSIKISFHSEKKSNDYNLYKLDTVKKNWVYKGKDKIFIQKNKKIIVNSITDDNLNFVKDSLRIMESSIAELLLQKPLAPVQANPKKWHFKLDIIANEFPELAVYNNTIFEIDEQYKPLNQKHPSIIWDDAIIEKADKPMSYFVTFSKDTLKCKYLVRPVLNEKNFTLESQKYANKFSVYQTELAKRKKAEEELTKLLAQQLENNRIARIRDSIIYEEMDKSAKTEGLVIRSFEVMNFGIWNCDKAMNSRNAKIAEPSFSVNDTTYFNTVYLADVNRNALIPIYSGNEIRFDRSSKNLLWMITDKNQLAIFKPEDFKIVPTNAKAFTFRLTKLKSHINNSADFIKLYKSGFKDL